jgi:predicted DNA binding CopG/RHH family protein
LTISGPFFIGLLALEAIQKRALAEGLPYQTLISSLLHKYASGRLKEV